MIYCTIYWIMEWIMFIEKKCVHTAVTHAKDEEQEEKGSFLGWLSVVLAVIGLEILLKEATLVNVISFSENKRKNKGTSKIA